MIAIVVSNPEICEWLSNKGVKKCHAMQLGGAYNFPWGNVEDDIGYS